MTTTNAGNNKDFVKELRIFALATDPIYIGTGGYTIGRVDNTIVRDPTTNVIAGIFTPTTLPMHL
jgi:hypothetical protein